MILKKLKKNYYLYIFFFFYVTKISLTTENIPLITKNIPLTTENIPLTTENTPLITQNIPLEKNILTFSLNKNNGQLLKYIAFLYIIFMKIYFGNNLENFPIFILLFFFSFPLIIFLYYFFFGYVRNKYGMFRFIYNLLLWSFLSVIYVKFSEEDPQNKFKIFYNIILPCFILNIFQWTRFIFIINMTFFLLILYLIGLYNDSSDSNKDQKIKIIIELNTFKLLIFFISSFLIEFLINNWNDYQILKNNSFIISLIIMVILFINNIIHKNNDISNEESTNKYKKDFVIKYFFNNLFFNFLLFTISNNKALFLKIIKLFNKKFFKYDIFIKFFIKILILESLVLIIKLILQELPNNIGNPHIIYAFVQSQNLKKISNLINLLLSIGFDLNILVVLLNFFYYHGKNLIVRYLTLKKFFVDVNHFNNFFQFCIIEIFSFIGLFGLTILHIKIPQYFSLLNLLICFLFYFISRKKSHIINEILYQIYIVKIEEVKKNKINFLEMQNIVNDNLRKINIIYHDKDEENLTLFKELFNLNDDKQQDNQS
jgi:hypothetical protein